MSKSRILTIGLRLASSDFQYQDFNSKTSLLDWDIVLFRPEIGHFFYGMEMYRGKPCLSDGASFKLKECCEHWRREINQAVEAGKTVIVFLSELEEIFVDSGRRERSGTGRNQKTTRFVDEFNNYQAIPESLIPVSATGSKMKLSSRYVEVLNSYWAEFESFSQYKVQLTDPTVPACIVTITGEKTVGAIYRNKSSPGTLLLLPYIDFDADEFTEVRDEEEFWTPEAHKFAERMLKSVVALDKALRSSRDVTPEPTWASEPEYALQIESDLRVRLLEAEREVEKAQKFKEGLEGHLRSVGGYRALLYEKGKPLENTIIDALRILGFTADPYRDSDSEFDAVFESKEGRLIGEAEGKDNKPINIDKFRQLALNIHEDFQRETVTNPAKPVLFGNGYRLQKLDDRENPFTEKCNKAAATNLTALVFTPDLFRVVRYLLENGDPEYAKNCRLAILATTGRVSFPQIPKVEKTTSMIQAENVN